jgi:hypothetical protein
MSEIHAKARVQITLEVDAGSPWVDDCSIGQLYKQAADDGLRNLNNALKPGAASGMQVVGEPKVICIVTEKS